MAVQSECFFVMIFLKYSIECSFFSNAIVSVKIFKQISSQTDVENVSMFLKNEKKKREKERWNVDRNAVNSLNILLNVPFQCSGFFNLLSKSAVKYMLKVQECFYRKKKKEW